MMASVPCCTFAAGRVHNELAIQRQKSTVEYNDSLTTDLLGNGQPPAPTVYLERNGQTILNQHAKLSSDVSMLRCPVPVDNKYAASSPSILIRSDSGLIDLSTLTQAQLKPVPSQSTPGIGPRKG